MNYIQDLFQFVLCLFDSMILNTNSIFLCQVIILCEELAWRFIAKYNTMLSNLVANIVQSKKNTKMMMNDSVFTKEKRNKKTGKKKNKTLCAPLIRLWWTMILGWQYIWLNFCPLSNCFSSPIDQHGIDIGNLSEKNGGWMKRK